MAASEVKKSLDAKLVCRIKCSVAVDLSLFEKDVFSKEWVAGGKPNIEKKQTGEHCVVLYNTACGVMDTESSKALQVIKELKPISTQAFVGIDSAKPNTHCLVAVNVLAPSESAHMTIKSILSCYGPNWSNYLSFPSEVAKDKYIFQLLALQKSSNATRDNGNHESVALTKRSNSASSIEESKPLHVQKRIKLSTSISDGNIADINSFSRELLPYVNLSSSANSSDKDKHALDKSNISNLPMSTVENKETKSIVDNSILNKTDFLLKNIHTQLSAITDPPTYKNDAPLKNIIFNCTTNVTNVTNVLSVKDHLRTIINDLTNSTQLTATNLQPPLRVVTMETSIHQNSITDATVAVTNTSTPTTSSCLNNNFDTILKNVVGVANTSSPITSSCLDNNFDTRLKNVVGVAKTSTLTTSSSLNNNFDTILKNVVAATNTSIQTNICVNNNLDTILKNIVGTDVNVEVKKEQVSPKKFVCADPKPGSSSIPDTIRDTIPDTIRDTIRDTISYNTTIDGEPTDTSDLPENIKQRLAIFERANLNSSTNRNSRNNAESDGLPNLMDEGGSSGICRFLLRRTPNTSGATCSTSQQNTSNVSPTVNSQQPVDNNDGNVSDDDELNFPSNFLARRQKRHFDPLSDANTEDADSDADEAPAVITVNETRVNNNTEHDDDDSVLVVIKDELDDIFDLMSELPKDVEAEPCPGIRCTMLPHQKKALHWMMLKENTNELPPFWECIHEGCDYFNLGTRRRIYERPKAINGGILADDMGLGKTLVTIALILTNHIGGRTMKEQKQILPVDAADIVCTDLKMHKKKKSNKSASATVNDFKKPGFQFRQIYLEKLMKKKGKQKKQDEQMFSSDIDEDMKPIKHVNRHVDTIINNIQTSSNNSSSSTTRAKFGCSDTNSKASLIVCPMSVLSNWTDQFKQHVCPTLKVQIYLYYGPDRIRDVEYLRKHDIIITTYGTLAADYRAMNSKGKSAPLHKINWLRVVLDEGHIIRNSKSQQSIAAAKLNALRRWILTGTVIQNRMSDLWSVIRFLHIDPFTNKRWWNLHVVKSMERRARAGQICFNRIQKIVNHIAIRRLKTDKVRGEPLVVLPKREVDIAWVTFSDEERKVYDAMQQDGKFIVSKYFQMNTIFKNYANVLVIIMRLRQLCCHPTLCTKAIEKLDKARNIMDHLKETLDDLRDVDADLDGIESDSMNDEDHQKLLEQIMMFLASGDSEECSICLEILTDPVITRCAHIFCSPCINEVIDNTEGITPCPLCRTDVEPNTLVNVPSIDENLEKENVPEENTEVVTDEEWQSSAKIDLLMEKLTDLRREDPDIKSLVVSQFTSFLDIVEKPLKKAGFQFVRLDGRMTQAARFQVMEEFKETDSLSPTIMLLSLMAGGVGLNLISASRVFLLDPAWNPAAEEQCFDRCHRLGQTKDVKVYKLIVKDSVEERMLILQDKKRDLMKKAFGARKQTPEQRRRAALQDIGTLLDLNLFRRNVPRL